MMSRCARPLLAALSSTMILVVPLAAQAFSYIPIGDADLLDRADLVVAGQIETGTALPQEGETQYAVAATDVIKGQINTLVDVDVLVPGSDGLPNGERLEVLGSPSFLPGQQVLLFLAQRADGRYAVAELALGAFYAESLNKRLVWVRGLDDGEADGGSELGAKAKKQHCARDAALFVRWLRDRAKGNSRVPDYWIDTCGPSSALFQKYTTLASPPARWGEFDAQQSVTLYNNDLSLLGLLGFGSSQLRSAIDTWNNDPDSNVNYVYGGLLGSLLSSLGFGGSNGVVFGDPFQSIAGAFDCHAGGVVATTSYRYGPMVTGSYGAYYPMLQADVVVQDGAECLLYNQRQTLLSEVITHELGHTLGLAHSCGDNGSDCVAGSASDRATMRALAHDDGRGASLRSDDLAGIKFLYPMLNSTSVPPPSGGGGSDGGGGGGGAVGVLDLLVLLMLAAARRSRGRGAG